MKKLVIVSAIFVSALVVLVWVGIVQGSVPVLELEQIVGPRSSYDGGKVQLDGAKIAGIESLTPLRFTVASSRNPELVVNVQSERLPPENFREGIKVSLSGRFDRSRRLFVAEKVSTQCPSRYEAASEASGATATGGSAPDA